mmetsp:Transcript_37802/g.108042  ORF Transcript_37802/g.108042 Transcript_37802/m.108042 type:complete len:233 (+) Transcript_37802:890-1588(+)
MMVVVVRGTRTSRGRVREIVDGRGRRGGRQGRTAGTDRGTSTGAAVMAAAVGLHPTPAIARRGDDGPRRTDTEIETEIGGGVLLTVCHRVGPPPGRASPPTHRRGGGGRRLRGATDTRGRADDAEKEAAVAIGTEIITGAVGGVDPAHDLATAVGGRPHRPAAAADPHPSQRGPARPHPLPRPAADRTPTQRQTSNEPAKRRRRTSRRAAWHLLPLLPVRVLLCRPLSTRLQ